ncbi:RNAse P Rpr2/Rpp21/SNM1 subunit domain-containing protein [Radiomyces spectabilis]|uniref:RNAse P Rpr2/Rpp21/SNM1 subunit domain-containing protein n=1 Tax=Radiomyces spectabilis TaxID=64574 RepID=UPI00221F0BBE|nr:RNAse P Rpr2/Rpp21/SNM1 subunit domain-containing protein [Radiomyces spectabilis]KAI8391638.1 RNAse P Rpr2/Rpp21/SNM1 subunit domain-containing protein [Radiomyces spectabilis]
MARKKEAKAQGPSRDHLQTYQRMNFLYQASALMAATTAQTQQEPRSKWNDNRTRSLNGLGRYYNSTMRKMARRLVIRLDPHVKRSICKRCDTMLLPGKTSAVRIQHQPETTTVTTCLICNTHKRLIARPDYELFNDKAEIRPDMETEAVEKADA